MTHDCPVCHEIVCDNNPKTKCPTCGSNMIHTWDEQDTDREPDDFEEMNRNEANDYRDEN